MLTPSLPRPLDPAGLHGMLLFFVTPALALVLWGRWLGFALVLVSLAAFMCVSVVGDGMISNWPPSGRATPHSARGRFALASPHGEAQERQGRGRSPP